ncbi:MAG: hypothetical protein AAF447_05025 [Myxococcota bacterium]
MIRALAFASLAGLTLASSFVVPVSAQNAAVPDALLGRWVLASRGRATQSRDAGIERTVAEVFALGRGIARRRLRAGLPVFPSFRVARDGTRALRVEFRDAYRVAQPVNGTWTRIQDLYGEPMDSRLRVRDGDLVQSLRSEDGESLITHRFAAQEDGTLVLSVRLANDQLDRDVVFRMRYQRAP